MKVIYRDVKRLIVYLVERPILKSEQTSEIGSLQISLQTVVTLSFFYSFPEQSKTLCT